MKKIKKFKNQKLLKVVLQKKLIKIFLAVINKKNKGKNK